MRLPYHSGLVAVLTVSTHGRIYREPDTCQELTGSSRPA